MFIPIPLLVLWSILFCWTQHRLDYWKMIAEAQKNSVVWWHERSKEYMRDCRRCQQEVNERDKDLHDYSGSVNPCLYTYPHLQQEEKSKT